MINKPKIYSHCDAGCKWETVHRSEFSEIAPFVFETRTNESYTLEIGKLYRIENADNSDSWNFNIECTIFENDTEIDPPVMSPIGYTFPLPDFYKNEPWIDFKVVGIDVHHENRVVQVRYKINNNSFIQTIAEADINHYVPEDCLRVVSVDSKQYNVYLKNDGAIWILKPHQVFVRYADDEFGTNMSEIYTNQKYIGMYCGEVASPVARDYTWAKFVGEASGEDSIYRSYFVDGAAPYFSRLDGYSNVISTVNVDISQGYDGSDISWGVFYEYFRQTIFQMRKIEGGDGVTVHGASGVVGLFIKDRYGDDWISDKLLSFFEAGSVLNFNNLDSFKVEMIGGYNTAAECMMVVHAYTKDAETYVLQIACTNGECGTYTTKGWRKLF